MRNDYSLVWSESAWRELLETSIQLPRGVDDRRGFARLFKDSLADVRAHEVRSVFMFCYAMGLGRLSMLCCGAAEKA